MTELLTEDRVFKNDIFSPIPLGGDGDADGLPSVTEVDYDEELVHENWPVDGAKRRLGRHILDKDPENIEAHAAYGYTVYRALLEEEPLEVVYLDPRCFMPDTDLLDVLEQAAKCALDEGNDEVIKPIVTAMIHTAGGENFGGDKMRKYIDTVMSSGNYAAIRVYVEFMNANTVKGIDSSKSFLKRMAHEIQKLPDNPDHTAGVDRLGRQILLEDVGHAWIRKGMPVAEIDWLP